MFKVKRVRTIDAVLVGWRPGKEPDTVGALILGLYDGTDLRVVGHCSGLSAAEKRRLVDFLAPYESGERGSADPSRWSSGKDLEWVGLRPELVSRSTSTTSPPGASATAPSCAAGARTSPRASARSSSCRRDALRFGTTRDLHVRVV